MKFTLIITTFNSQNYVEFAIQSALNQKRKPDEIIICDDNSSDNTVEICKKYYGISIHINPQGPSGYTNAYNYALKLGTGEYVSVLHYDDLLHPDYFFHSEKAFKDNPECKFLVSRSVYFKNDPNCFDKYEDNRGYYSRLTGAEYSKAYLNGVKTNNHINRCPGTIFHRSISELIGFRREANLISDDDLFYRVGQYTDVILLTEPFAGVRLHTTSESAKLTPLRLSLALANGYFFMINDWKEKYVVGREGLEFFLESFFIHNFRTLYWSVIYKDQISLKQSIDLYRQITSSKSNLMKAKIKLYHRAAFFLARSKLIFINVITFKCYYWLSK